MHPLTYILLRNLNQLNCKWQSQQCAQISIDLHSFNSEDKLYQSPVRNQGRFLLNNFFLFSVFSRESRREFYRKLCKQGTTQTHISFVKLVIDKFLFAKMKNEFCLRSNSKFNTNSMTPRDISSPKLI